MTLLSPSVVEVVELNEQWKLDVPCSLSWHAAGEHGCVPAQAATWFVRKPCGHTSLWCDGRYSKALAGKLTNCVECDRWRVPLSDLLILPL